MWLWWAIPAAYLAVAAIVQPRIASVRYKAGQASSSSYDRLTPAEASASAFGYCLIWPAMLIIMRGQQGIQAALDDERMRADAREQIAQHNREIAQREADDFERALNGADGLPKHVKARNLNFDFIGAHVAGVGSYGREFSGKLEGIGFKSASVVLHINVGGDYKYPDPDTVLTINGGTA